MTAVAAEQAVADAAQDRLVLELRDVTKEYAGEVHALRGVSLTVQSGELVGIVGRPDRASRRCCT